MHVFQLTPYNIYIYMLKSDTECIFVHTYRYAYLTMYNSHLKAEVSRLYLDFPDHK